jgi:hypothetical protein
VNKEHLVGENFAAANFIVCCFFDTWYLGTKYFVFARYISWKIGVVQQQAGR